jgi:hypothetical protein
VVLSNLQEILKKFLHFYFFKENGKIGRARGGRYYGIMGCHVASWQSKPIDLAVSVRCCKVVNVAVKLENCTKGKEGIFCGQKMFQVGKFIMTYVHRMVTILFPIELCVSELKC